jgi:predicted dienelactone hydrolase
VVFSHGLGGSRDGAEYLGRHLASHRYAAIHVQHRGSDIEIWKEGVQAALRNARENLQAALDRFRDIQFTVDQIEAMNAEGPFSGRFDLERMGISGHSYGAITTLVAAGQSRGAFGHRLAEARFKAALAFSPSPPRNGSPAEAFADMLMPIFHVTGTADGDPYGELKPIDRQIPFRAIGDVDQYLLVLEDAVHMTFSGRDAGYTKLPRHHDLVRMASLAFWDAYLREDATAKRWLAGGGFATALGEDGDFETKLLP